MSCSVSQPAVVPDEKRDLPRSCVENKARTSLAKSITATIIKGQHDIYLNHLVFIETLFSAQAVDT